MRHFLAILILLLSVGAVRADITSNLVAHWKLDETSGTSAADSSGSGYTGTYVNSPTLNQTGAFGSSKAVTFATAGTTYVDGVHAAALNNLPLTLAYWVKTTSSSTLNVMVNKYVSASSNGWFSYLNNGKPIAWYYVSAGNSVANSTSTAIVNDGSWHHVVDVFNATNGCKLYVDGTLSSTVAWTGTAGTTTTTQAVRIGRYASGANYADATIDDVRIYSRALSADDVAELYAYTGTQFPYWYFQSGGLRRNPFDVLAVRQPLAILKTR